VVRRLSSGPVTRSPASSARAAPRRSGGRWRRAFTRLCALAALGAVIAAVVLTTTVTLRHSTTANTPDTPQHVTRHHVLSGDTLATIAARYHTTVASLEELNPNVDPQALYPGEVLRVGS